MIPFQEENTTHFQCHKVNTWQLCIRKLFFSVERVWYAMDTSADTYTWQGDADMWGRWGTQSLQEPESSVPSQFSHEVGLTKSRFLN